MRHRQALVVFLLVVTLVNLFAPLARWALVSWPVPLRTALVVAAQVILMTYVIMPRVHRRWGAWLAGQAPAQGEVVAATVPRADEPRRASSRT